MKLPGDPARFAKFCGRLSLASFRRRVQPRSDHASGPDLRARCSCWSRKLGALSGRVRRSRTAGAFLTFKLLEKKPMSGAAEERPASATIASCGMIRERQRSEPAIKDVLEL